jgi:hypothetical protein
MIRPNRNVRGPHDKGTKIKKNCEVNESLSEAGSTVAKKLPSFFRKDDSSNLLKCFKALSNCRRVTAYIRLRISPTPKHSQDLFT